MISLLMVGVIFTNAAVDDLSIRVEIIDDPFRLYASWMFNEHSFQIKSFISEHKCCRNYNLRSLVTYKRIVRVGNSENCGWFLHLLHDDMSLNERNGITIISDSHKRLSTENVQGTDWVVFPSGFQELEVRKGNESYGVNLLNKGWWKFYRGDGSGGSGSEMGGCDGIGDGSGGSASGIGGSGGIGDGSGGRGGGKNNKGGGRGRRGGGMASRGGGEVAGVVEVEEEVPDRSASTIAIFATLETSDTTKVSEDAQIDKGNASASVDKGKAPTTVKKNLHQKGKKEGHHHITGSTPDKAFDVDD
uniref:Uncharacterized protein n=1 Tax=Tanacetum cinerariifolium TaxID=118510 RepID=A0A699HC53_TANCI|nr:hypothetical protein [Tanacetum cinerariifolium]